MLDEFLESALLLLVLLNPFMLSVYLQDLIQELAAAELWRVLRRAGLIASGVFLAFAVGGDAIFSTLQVRYGSFLVFGGVLFLVIAVRYVVLGADTMTKLRGEPKQVAGAIAMPFMVGPGTVSASVYAGGHLPLLWAVAAVLAAVFATVAVVLVLHWVYHRVHARNESLTQRYADIVGRISALLIGTVAVDMIFRGVQEWLELSG